MFGKGDKEGPTVVPAHEVRRHVPEYRVCDGCKYFDSHREGNVCGGFGARLGPLVTKCSHPDAMHYYRGGGGSLEGDELPMRDPNLGTPRRIWSGTDTFRTSITPDWCPYLKKEPV